MAEAKVSEAELKQMAWDLRPSVGDYFCGKQIASWQFTPMMDQYLLCFDDGQTAVVSHNELHQSVLYEKGYRHVGHRNANQASHGSPAGQSGGSPGGAGSVVTGFALTAGPHVPKSVPYAGIRAGEIIGHRIWLYESGCLRSLYRPTVVWPVGSRLQANGNVRVCEVYLGCRYQSRRGIHAHKAPNGKEWEQDLTFALTRKVWELNEQMVVIGTVALWGDVVEHERGYRAQFAKPVRFDFAYSQRVFADEHVCLSRSMLDTVRRQYTPDVNYDASP